MSEYTTEQARALASIVMLAPMPIEQRAKSVNIVSYASEIFDELKREGRIEMRKNDVWTGRIRNLKEGGQGKPRVKEVLEACGVEFTGGNRSSGPLIATLKEREGEK
jgi:hypothetical protein